MCSWENASILYLFLIKYINMILNEISNNKLSEKWNLRNIYANVLIV